MREKKLGRRIVGWMFAILMLCAGGCTNNSSNSSKPKSGSGKEEADSLDIRNNKCAVMVFADWHTRTEYNQIQLDTARLLTRKLEILLNATKEENKSDTPARTEFLNPASVVRFQREHPEVSGQPIVEVAPRLGGISRLVYVEYEDFSTQPSRAIMLLKGTAKATLRIVEVNNGKAKIVYEEAGIAAKFPPEAPEGVVPSDKINVRTVYEGTLDQLTNILAAKFHRVEE